MHCSGALLSGIPGYTVFNDRLYRLSLNCARIQKVYRVVQKTDTQFYFWDNFGNSAPIITILSLLQAEIYGAKT